MSLPTPELVVRLGSKAVTNDNITQVWALGCIAIINEHENCNVESSEEIIAKRICLTTVLPATHEFVASYNL